ncbi:MAG: hypothetical protein HZA81_01445 [Candidatus Taylorbacteria bacterium]|nr:hypothetical protein [Candidatus Taylorbacteria bacterium]
MKSNTPTAQASASAADPATAGPATTASASASVPASSDKDPEILEETPISEHRKMLMAFTNNVNRHIDDAIAEIRKTTPSPGKWLFAFFLLFALVATAVCFALWKVDASVGVLRDATDLDLRFAEQTRKITGSIEAQARRLAEERSKDRSILARIEESDVRHLEVQRAQAEATKAISNNLGTIVPYAEKAATIESAVASLAQEVGTVRDGLGEIRAEARKAASDLVLELGAVKAKLEAATPPPPPLPVNPAASAPRVSQATASVPAPLESPFGGQTLSKGESALSKERWTYRQVAPGMESPKMSLSEAERSVVVQSGKTFVRHYFWGMRDPVDVPVPPSGRIDFYRNAHRICLVSDQQMQIWTRER